MTDLEYENGITNNSSANDKENTFAKPTATTESEENHDAEITRLFDDARDDLEMVDANARKQKRQIVVIWQEALRERLLQTQYLWRLLTNCVVKSTRVFGTRMFG